MEMAPYKMLVIDASSHSLLLVNGPTGKIMAAMSYPGRFAPTALAVTADGATAYMPAVSADGAGALFLADLSSFSLHRLPVLLPHPAQFALAPTGDAAYIADPQGTLHSLDTTTLNIKRWGHSNESICVALAATTGHLYSAWEVSTGGVVASFTAAGELVNEYSLYGIPTNITVTAQGQILVPFTVSTLAGEGLAIFNEKKADGLPTIVSIQCPACIKGNRAYPCHIALSDNERTAYIANEDSGSVTVIDVQKATVLDWFTIGRSISGLYILPDRRFAIATSNMFCDLVLIDLVNGRLLSFTDENRELLSYLAVLPA